jgi:hypothetical protein
MVLDMVSTGSSVGEQLRGLQEVLGLDSATEDWGIVNADPSRVTEFVSFFEQRYNTHWSPGTVAEFVDLVLESACSAARADPAFPISCIDNFVARAGPLAPTTIEYWTRNSFPVTSHLRALDY